MQVVHRGQHGAEHFAAAVQVVQIGAAETAIVDVTGAGDSMIAAFCHVLLEGGSPQDAARLGHAAAALTVASPHTVRADLTMRMTEYIVLHVLMHHRRQRLYDAQQRERLWRVHDQPAASEVAMTTERSSTIRKGGRAAR